MQLVMHADAPSSSMRVWESESNCLSRACGVVQPLGHVEVMQVAVVKGHVLVSFVSDDVHRYDEVVVDSSPMERAFPVSSVSGANTWV